MAKGSQNQVNPEELSASCSQFSAHWQQELRRLEDVCRQQRYAAKVGLLELDSMYEDDLSPAGEGLPNLFITVSAAEWSYPLHKGLLQHQKSQGTLSKWQTRLTLHIRNTMIAVMKKLFSDKALLGLFQIRAVNEYSIRIEFQKRGPPHIHCIAWAEYNAGASDRLTGRSGEDGSKSILAQFLETVFKSSVDVQASLVLHCLNMLLGMSRSRPTLFPLNQMKVRAVLVEKSSASGDRLSAYSASALLLNMK